MIGLKQPRDQDNLNTHNQQKLYSYKVDSKVTELHKLYLNSVVVTLSHWIILFNQLRQIKDTRIMILSAAGQNLKS